MVGLCGIAGNVLLDAVVENGEEPVILKAFTQKKYSVFVFRLVSDQFVTFAERFVAYTAVPELLTVLMNSVYPVSFAMFCQVISILFVDTVRQE